MMAQGPGDRREREGGGERLPITYYIIWDGERGGGRLSAPCDHSTNTNR